MDWSNVWFAQFSFSAACDFEKCGEVAADENRPCELRSRFDGEQQSIDGVFGVSLVASQFSIQTEKVSSSMICRLR